ncbi:hypothetical protein ACQR3P_14545 [Rhodococcus sp. IEGM1300]
MCEYELADDVIKDFLLDSTAEVIDSVQKEISTLLEVQMEETELREFLLKDMSCYYCYWHEWESGRTWLNHISNVLRSQPSSS